MRSSVSVVLAILIGGAAPAGVLAHDVHSTPEVQRRVLEAVRSRSPADRDAAAVAALDVRLADVPIAEVEHIVGHAEDLPADYAQWLGDVLGWARTTPGLADRHEVGVLLFDGTEHGTAQALRRLVAVHDRDTTRAILTNLLRARRVGHRLAAAVLATQAFLLHEELREYARSVLVRLLRDESPALRYYLALFASCHADEAILAPIFAGLTDKARPETHEAGDLRRMQGTVGDGCRTGLLGAAHFRDMPFTESDLREPQLEVLRTMADPERHGWDVMLSTVTTLREDHTQVIALPGGGNLEVTLHAYEVAVLDDVLRRRVNVTFAGSALAGGSLRVATGAHERYAALGQHKLDSRMFRYWIAPGGDTGHPARVEVWRRRERAK